MRKNYNEDESNEHQSCVQFELSANRASRKSKNLATTLKTFHEIRDLSPGVQTVFQIRKGSILLLIFSRLSAIQVARQI